MGLFSKKSNSQTTNNESTAVSTDNRIIDTDGFVGGNVTISGDDNVITDAGAIAGNIAIANRALETAKTITQDISDNFEAGFDSVSSLSKNFSSALESIKKTELTDGGSLFTDILKFWPVIPVAIVGIVFIKSRGAKKNG